MAGVKLLGAYTIGLSAISFYLGQQSTKSQGGVTKECPSEVESAVISNQVENSMTSSVETSNDLISYIRANKYIGAIIRLQEISHVKKFHDKLSNYITTPNDTVFQLCKNNLENYLGFSNLCYSNSMHYSLEIDKFIMDTIPLSHGHDLLSVEY